jgi:hypothetical protein
MESVMSRTIAEVSKDIETTTEIVNYVLEAVPSSQRPAVQTAMIQASERLPKLLDEMKEAVIPSKLIGLFADGDKTSIDKVAEFLTRENEDGTNNGGIVLDAAQLYRSITDLVEGSYSRDRIFCTTQYSLMIQKISTIAIDLGYREIESPKFKETICPNTAATLAHIRNCLRECRVGDQANIDLLTKALVDAIVRNQIDSKQIPVMIIGVASMEERNAIATLFSRSFDYTFKVGFEPTAQKIVALFKAQKQVDVEEPKKDDE